MAPNMLVPKIVLRLLEEQANTISKVKLNKIGFYGFGLWFWFMVLVENFINQGRNKNPQTNTELNHANWIN